MSEPFLIVGLGNPGARYETTRHNVGFMAIDEIAENHMGSFSVHKKSNAEILETRIGDTKVVLAKPRTFMNLSGGPIRALCDFFKIPPTHVIVIHDELDLDFGTVRLKQGGGENGHNGLRSTSQTLGTKDYYRIRIGIGRPPGRQDPASYVLKPFSVQEAADLGAICADAAEGAELIVTQGLAAAQNRIHGK
ncbi:aminoacyl-tRNA hydrolase [Corynebacterium hindlerae]|uniref:aminoacyl-tRNA hydrolase n=1 Tax=Corynebacterium hindlerae TaxID=699041 RepID=UPI0031B69E10